MRALTLGPMVVPSAYPAMIDKMWTYKKYNDTYIESNKLEWCSQTRWIFKKILNFYLRDVLNIFLYHTPYWKTYIYVDILFTIHTESALMTD